MERKRKRQEKEGDKKNPQNKQAKTQEGKEKETAWDSLPNEIAQKILYHSTQNQYVYMRLICGMVCKLWRDLLPPKPCSSYFQGKSFLTITAEQDGSVSLLEWARSAGCPWDAKTCAAAARGGHLDALKWLKSQGCPWDATSCTEAASRGDLDMLKWLREAGCPWDPNAAIAAAREGRLEVLKWMKVNEGPTLGVTHCVVAARQGHKEVLEWAMQNL